MLYSLEQNRLADALVKENERKLSDLTHFQYLSETLVSADRFYLLHSLVDTHLEVLLSDAYYGDHYIMPLRYPLAFKTEVEHFASLEKLSSLLVFAVMREESRFRPYVKSPAGAIGLLQLMPKTARYLGKQQRMRIGQGHLIDPKINLQLGTYYLKKLYNRYDGNLYYTLAAYNGGATNVKRWIKKNPFDDMDYFVEIITFNETKNYVKRVLKSYYLYRNIYGPL